MVSGWGTRLRPGWGSGYGSRVRPGPKVQVGGQRPGGWPDSQGSRAGEARHTGSRLQHRLRQQGLPGPARACPAQRGGGTWAPATSTRRWSGTLPTMPGSGTRRSVNCSSASPARGCASPCLPCLSRAGWLSCNFISHLLPLSEPPLWERQGRAALPSRAGSLSASRCQLCPPPPASPSFPLPTIPSESSRAGASCVCSKLAPCPGAPASAAQVPDALLQEAQGSAASALARWRRQRRSHTRCPGRRREALPLWHRHARRSSRAAGRGAHLSAPGRWSAAGAGPARSGCAPGGPAGPAPPCSAGLRGEDAGLKVGGSTSQFRISSWRRGSLPGVQPGCGWCAFLQPR